MAVTLPATLLLLDFWPLQRWPAESWRRLIWEKVSLVLIAVAHSVVVLIVQFGSGAATFAMRVPPARRPGWERLGQLCSISGEIRVAIRPGRALSASDLVALGQHPHEHNRPRGNHRAGVALEAIRSLDAHGLAVVPRNPRARHRTRSGRRAGHGGPLHVYSGARPRHRRGVVGCRGSIHHTVGTLDRRCGRCCCARTADLRLPGRTAPVAQFGGALRARPASQRSSLRDPQLARRGARRRRPAGGSRRATENTGPRRPEFSEWLRGCSARCWRR